MGGNVSASYTENIVPGVRVGVAPISCSRMGGSGNERAVAVVANGLRRPLRISHGEWAAAGVVNGPW